MTKTPPYNDLHQHIAALKKQNLLIEIDRQIDKDSEMHALVRWQFIGGMKEEDRKAFLFTNIVDGKGRKFDMPVLVGGLAANRSIYSVGMVSSVEGIQANGTMPFPTRLIRNLSTTHLAMRSLRMAPALASQDMGLTHFPFRSQPQDLTAPLH